MTTLAIRGGTVLTASGTHTVDLMVRDGRIDAWRAPGTADDADTVIDATGLHVAPGFVDVHTHLETVVAGVSTADDFASGTRAAAFGGTTTVVDFVRQGPGEDLLERLDDAGARARGRCAIDYGFHQIVGDVHETSLGQLPQLVAAGVPSIKLFMAFPGDLYSDDSQLLGAMERAAELGVTVMVHAENGLAMEYLRTRARERGDVSLPWHAKTATPAIEAEATRRAIFLAELAGMPTLYFVHVSSAEALAAIADARRRGLPVFAETCPHYLYLDVAELDRPWEEGADYVCAPPLRTREHRDRLWWALSAGDLSVVSSDHCPFCRSTLFPAGQRDFTKLPGGIAGIEYRVPLLYDAALRGKIPLSRFTDVTSTSPARLFGMHPDKGSLAPGAHADITLLDPRGATRTGASDHHMRVDHSAFEGLRLRGSVHTVLLRGRTLVDRGRWTGPEDGGRFVPRRPGTDLYDRRALPDGDEGVVAG
ncbi:dihydropyrimidinase [Streptomyces catenulae]|uniref:Dihydropyrimidinase n=1 Tax=Streptomyces catenulae TaxID=66875 RepID=A0ABV2YZH9_9ACTN|nr:dihydropyrimidinase [Streptomyces catenulae]